ncbi:MAG: AI-2E family transporter [Thermoflexaceae bacterium]|nr:AI-2E family transporter [Thermoflexaceae bacterium]
MTDEEKNTSPFNRKYFMISIHVILIILAGTIIFKAITDWASVYSVINYVIRILSPFIIGLCFAFILNPLVNWINSKIFKKIFKKINNKKIPYYLSMLVTYFIVIGLIVVLMIFVIPQIYFSLVDLTNTITEQYFIIMEQLNNSPETWHNINIDSIISIINNSIPQLVSYISGITTNLIPFLYNTSLSVIKGLWNVILGIIISVYMLGDRDNLVKNLNRLIYAVIPPQKSEVFLKTGRESIDIFSRYVTGKTLDSLIIGCLTFIIMSVFKLDFKLLISALVGITNMIPYFGPFLGGAIGFLILLIKTPVNAILFAVLILIIQQFDGLYLGPKILGESTGLKPLWVIFAIIVGGSIFGIMGMLIGVPTVAVLSYILNIFIESRLKKRDLNYVDGRVHSINKKTGTS